MRKIKEEKETEKHNKGKKQLYAMSIVGAVLALGLVVYATNFLLDGQQAINNEQEGMTEYDHYINEVMPVLDLVLSESAIVWRDKWITNFKALSETSTEVNTEYRDMEILGDDMIRLNTMVKTLKPENISKQSMKELKVIQKDTRVHFEKRYSATLKAKNIIDAKNYSSEDVDGTIKDIRDSDRAKIDAMEGKLILEERLQKESRN